MRRYLRMMGSSGIRNATLQAILSANYMARSLSDDYPILFQNENGMLAHEFIVDCKHFKDSANIQTEDIAKRLIDFVRINFIFLFFYFFFILLIYLFFFEGFPCTDDELPCCKNTDD